MIVFAVLLSLFFYAAYTRIAKAILVKAFKVNITLGNISKTPLAAEVHLQQWHGT